MRITHLGHACLLIETGETQLLIDPGTYSAGFEALTGLAGILVTHQHADHIDMDRLPDLLSANPRAELLFEPETAADAPIQNVTSFHPGDTTTIGHFEVSALGGRHAANHDQVPQVGNVGFLMRLSDGPTLYHPGDSYAEVPDAVDVLALPLNAPWARVSETLDFVRRVSPTVVVPIHDGLLSEAGRAAYLMHVEGFSPDHTEVRDLADGKPVDF